MSYIFSFISRNGAMRFAQSVKNMGGRVRLVNAPSTRRHGCGLAVSCADYELCKSVLSAGHYADLSAVYSFDGAEYRTIYNVGN